MALSRLQTLLLLLSLLATLSQAHRPKIIREWMPIPAFRPKSKNGTLTFPSTPKLPPILRNLTLLNRDHPGNILTANTPYLQLSGVAVFSPKNILVINFFGPLIRIRLKVKKNANKRIVKLSGRAAHQFNRPFGMRLHRSRRTVPAAVKALKKALKSNPDGPRLVTVVDHAAAAASVGLSLPPSSVVVFGNPVIGSKLWTRRAPVGIELPLEMLIASSPLGIAYVGWNTASLLRVRFGLRDPKVADVLTTIDNALANLGGIAADRKLSPAGRKFDESRIITRKSIKIGMAKGDAVKAFTRLTRALNVAPPVGIAYQIAHDVSAMKAGLATRGKINRVVVFGNPSLGTVIMQRAFTAALDLPVKMGVWTTRRGASRFRVGYTTAEWIGRRHNVEVPEMLSAALENFAGVALQV